MNKLLIGVGVVLTGIALTKPGRNMIANFYELARMDWLEYRNRREAFRAQRVEERQAMSDPYYQ